MSPDRAIGFCETAGASAPLLSAAAWGYHLLWLVAAWCAGWEEGNGLVRLAFRDRTRGQPVSVCSGSQTARHALVVSVGEPAD